MTPEQANAAARGAQHAEDVVEIARNEDRRIDPDDVVTLTAPAFLTNDYDPTYLPSVRSGGSFVVTDDAALAIAAMYRNPAKYPRCPDCDKPIVAGGWGQGTGLHAWCHLARLGLAR